MPSTTQAAIRTQGLSKRFGATDALTDLDLEVRPGEVMGYLGPNGAGKTTTIRLLLGLIGPTAGRAEIFGLDCHADPVAAHRRLGYVPGEASLWPWLTGAETLHLLGRLHGPVDGRYQQLLAERFDLDPTRKVRSYSKGNRQKLLLVAALATRAELLLLDEPTAGLDPLMEATFRTCIGEARDRGQSVLLSSHILSEVQALCDRVAILRAGRLADVGTLTELRHLSAVSVEAHLERGPIDLRPVPGITGIEWLVGPGGRGTLLRCRVRGPMGPLLHALDPAGVVKLLSAEPSLEELFLLYYGAAPTATGADRGPEVRRPPRGPDRAA